jgi:hypothetical protein
MSTRRSDTINWEKEASIGKRHTDIQMLSALKHATFIRKWQKRNAVHVLNLSGAKPLFETMLLQNHPEIPWHFMAIESNPRVYAALVRNIRQYQRQMKKWVNEKYLPPGTCYDITTTEYPCTITRHFNRNNRDYDNWRVYDFINGDYMGTISEEKIQDNVHILTSFNVADQFAFALTLSAARGQPGTLKLLRQYAKKPFRYDFGEPVGEEQIFECKTKGLVNLFRDQAKGLGWNCELLAFHPYQGLRSTEYKFLFKYARK